MLFSSISSLGSISSGSSSCVSGKSLSGSYGSNNIALNIFATAKSTTSVNAGATAKTLLDATANTAADLNAKVNSTTTVSL